MKKELEEYRLQAIKKLEQEQANRATKLRELHQQMVELEAAKGASVSALLRATKPLPRDTVCPRCWIWDGKLIDLVLLPGRDDLDLFRCRVCNLEIESPA